MNDDMKEELNDCYQKIAYLDRLLMDRADEIERLREELIEAEKYNGYHQHACLEIERLREALRKIAESEIEINSAQAYAYCVFVAEAALQQKDSE